MNTGTTMFYERRQTTLPISFMDRRKLQRRSDGKSPSIERRRLFSQIRQFERQAVQIPVHLLIDGGEISGHTQNVSLGGLLIKLIVLWILALQ